MEQFTEEQKTKITEMANELAEKTYAFMHENLPEQEEFSQISIMICATIGIISSLGKLAHGKNETEQERLIEFISNILSWNFKKFNES